MTRRSRNLARLLAALLATPLAALLGGACGAEGHGRRLATMRPVTLVIPPVTGSATAETAADTPTERGVALRDFCGGWSETWGFGEDTDVTSHDIYVISAPAREVVFTAPQNPEYEFVQVAVSLADSSLVVNMVNHGSGENFVIDYDVELSRDRQTMDGKATTPDRTVTIRWDRLSPAALDEAIGPGTSAGIICEPN